MLNPTCDWCPSLAAYVIESQWESYWACSGHDVEMARVVAGYGVSILDIRKM